MDEKRRYSPITIRGIDRDLYKNVVKLARETGRTIGEVVNEALRLVVGLTGATKEIGREFIEGAKESGRRAIEVGGLEELTVSREDLEDIEGEVVFKNIKILRLSPDIPFELFNRKVKAVILCDEVVLPATYPKLKALTKFKLVKRVSTSNK